MLELLVQFMGEFLLQAVGEALVEIGLHSLAEPFRRPSNPWLASVGYAIFGALLGFLSLLVFHQHLTPAGAPRLLNLVLTPLVVGGVMSAMGSWRRRRGEALFRIDRFSYAFLFALTLALVRYKFAK
jgi:hypothetical protein